ncbi:3-hydroxyanthranilate 3,4-dioxygenase-like [Liolophura sinensis]|uniref:3-hydroxyanthranilate 3,4-dioxygenase-like n=1 Tax=Liolophura sinensis TaxID=3198878 RepID=UPI003159361C
MSSKRSGEETMGGPTLAKRREEDDESKCVPELFVPYNIDQWVEENKGFFQPPVCNKLMHEDGQMKVFFVGGPNQRRDYHIEEGEELFYMMKGDMCLKVLEKGVHRDIEIKEGQVFLLPARIPHSPQRKADTVGLVIERERNADELDGLRYFVEDQGKLTTETLYEKWFHCEDLGPQLAAVIKEFFTTEQYKTGKPVKGTISEKPPVSIDEEVSIDDPIYLKNWLEENRKELMKNGAVTLYGNGSQFEVMLFGKGQFSGEQAHLETFLWQLEGSCDLRVKDRQWRLEENGSVLVKAGVRYEGNNKEDSVTLVCYQDPSKKTE